MSRCHLWLLTCCCCSRCCCCYCCCCCWFKIVIKALCYNILQSFIQSCAFNVLKIKIKDIKLHLIKLTPTFCLRLLRQISPFWSKLKLPHQLFVQGYYDKWAYFGQNWNYLTNFLSKATKTNAPILVKIGITSPTFCPRLQRHIRNYLDSSQKSPKFSWSKL